MTAAGLPAPAERVALALRAIDRAAAGLHEAFPHVTESGSWTTLAGSDGPRWDGAEWRHGNWTGGFWVGCLWLAAALSGEARYAEAARRWADRLAGREHDDATHDLGFLFYPSHAVGALLGYDGGLAERALTAARTVRSRFVDAGGYIQAWGPRGHPDWVGTSTIDTMMNLPLLWWAARASGDPRYAAAAAAHAATTRRHFFRPDGSTYHLVVYQPRGAAPRKTTFQGSGPESCWARGQAWAVAGFAIAYRETRDAQFLAAAEDAARRFLARLPEDRVPYWDFDDPAIPRAPRDSSAGAIAAGGMLELADAHPSPVRAQDWRRDATALLDALAAQCQNRSPDRIDGILLHGCYSRPHGEGVDSALTWGDYFYLHAVGWVAAGRRPDSPPPTNEGDRRGSAKQC